MLFPRFWQMTAGLNGFLAIVMGAVSAHAIADVDLAAMAQRASTYHLIHACMLYVVAKSIGHAAQLVRYAFLAAIILFCGSLYTHALFGWPAALAPAGGMLFMLGWLALAFVRSL